MRTFIRKWTTNISNFNSTVADAQSFELEVTRLLVPLKVNVLTAFFSNFIRLIKFCGEIVISREMTEPMAEKFFSVLDRLSDDEPDIIHLLIPGCKATGPVHEDILQGFELSFDPFIDSEGYLIVDVVFQVVVLSDSLCYIVAIVDSWLQ
jgi:hypothetical protein